MLLVLFSVKFMSKTFLIREDDTNGPSFRQAFIVSIDGKQLFKSNWCTFLIKKNQPKKRTVLLMETWTACKKASETVHACELCRCWFPLPTGENCKQSACASMGSSTQPFHSCHWPAGSILPNAAPSARRSIYIECPQLGRAASMGWKNDPAWHW